MTANCNAVSKCYKFRGFCKLDSGRIRYHAAYFTFHISSYIQKHFYHILNNTSFLQLNILFAWEKILKSTICKKFVKRFLFFITSMLLYFRAKALYSNITNTGIDSLSANLTKCSNTLKQLVENLLPNCFSVFDHFVGLVLKRLREKI